MDDLVEPDAAEQLVEAGPIDQVAANERERIGRVPQVLNVGLFDFRVIKLVEIIPSPDRVPLARQAFAHMIADKTRSTGDQKIHG